MKKPKNKILLIFLFFIFLLLPKISLAVCPICVIAVTGGVGLSRWLGIDDVISGIWIGGLILALVLWCLNWLKKKKINFPFRGAVVFLSFYLLTVVSLYLAKFIGYSCDKLWGADKLFLGIIMGSLAFGFGMNLDYFLRKKNAGRVYFSFQKVALPIFIIIILSVVFYFITRC